MNQQEQKAKEFFALLASYGVTEVLVATPPEGGSAEAKIEADSKLSMIDQRDGKRKKIKPID